jgi:hypothetical protein
MLVGYPFAQNEEKYPWRWCLSNNVPGVGGIHALRYNFVSTFGFPQWAPSSTAI